MGVGPVQLTSSQQCNKMCFRLGLFLLVGLVVPKVFGACSTDKDCQDLLGEFAECSPEGNCGCMDFYVPDPLQPDCVAVVPYNKTCIQDIQCRGFLGENSRCNPTTKRCDCYSPLGGQVHYYDGSCYILKALGEPCLEDNQCILTHGGATNPLARCIGNVCSCFNESNLSLVTEEVEGVCVVQAEVVDLSLFATMLACSVALILFIYVIYRIAQRDKEDELPLTANAIQ